MLFDRSQDPLKEYLNRRASQNSSAKIATIWTLLDRNYEVLHKVWIYGIAFAVTCSVINPLAGWKEFITVPIVTVFMGAVVAIAELPLSMMLVLLVSITRAVFERLQRSKKP